ncbi:MAG: type II toxin-antitoxin system RelE/ParE family toxin [Terriglobales bacterium]
MKIYWSARALSDLVRLYEFLAPVNRAAAARVVQSLTAAPMRLAVYPRLGEKLEEFEPREVRRILVGNYEMRYEVREDAIFIVRLWHTREQR